MLLRCKESNQDFRLALLNWKNTPSEEMNLSPVERLFQRRTAIILTTTDRQLQKKPDQPDVHTFRKMKEK